MQSAPTIAKFRATSGPVASGLPESSPSRRATPIIVNTCAKIGHFAFVPRMATRGEKAILATICLVACSNGKARHHDGWVVKTDRQEGSSSVAPSWRTRCFHGLVDDFSQPQEGARSGARLVATSEAFIDKMRCAMVFMKSPEEVRAYLQVQPERQLQELRTSILK